MVYIPLLILHKIKQNARRIHRRISEMFLKGNAYIQCMSIMNFTDSWNNL